VYGNMRPRTGWVVHLVRFERHVIGEVVAVSIYVILLNRYLRVFSLGNETAAFPLLNCTVHP
jgi:hypothetical protein